MKIIVTGAAGFMGSHLFDYLLKKGHQLLGIDNYSIGEYKHPNIKKIDVAKEPVKLAAAIKNFKPDILFHLAAWAHEGLSQFSPIRITETNYNGYLNTLVPSIRAGVKRVVVCSSMSVYGNQNPPFDEDMSRKPVDIYAVAKSAMEEATEILSRVHGFEYIIVRPHNVYGPRQSLSDPYRNVVAIFINCLLRNKPFYIYGDGEGRRAFTYIDDFTPYLAKTGFIRQSGLIFNIGPEEDYSINDLAKEILKHFHDAPKPIYLPDRPLEVKQAFCTSDKAKKFLGYKTSISFSDGIAKMVKWAKEIGPKEPAYLNELELTNQDTPKTWKDKLI
ncbi:NAD-dependent epimerase/dehydratase family protein [Candidatus Daviesbacteria bacterium]|nr:NAD-dependent epimerase/dehydratase family protein [Candidatus Daviesbacteria bacterium]